MDNYQVTYGILGGGGTSLLTTPANKLSVTLNDLRMGTEYTISVLGINIAGDGPSTSVTESTFIDRELLALELDFLHRVSQGPSAPLNFQGESLNPFTISVSWRLSVTNGGVFSSSSSL